MAKSRRSISGKGETEETLGSGIASEQLDPEERCARRELGRLLAKAIAQLPPDLRQACLLRDVLHYSTQEVAAGWVYRW